jgi:regulator of nucleoside diphosphate kinase
MLRMPVPTARDFVQRGSSMLYQSPANTLPPIKISETEEHLLTLLATGAELSRMSEEVAQTLLTEMERADVISDDAMPENVVRMSSRVEFEIDGGKSREMDLVFPIDANIDEGRISVLTPIGAALIGLSPGQTMMFRGRDNRPHKLRVISVHQPVASAAVLA